MFLGLLAGLVAYLALSVQELRRRVARLEAERTESARTDAATTAAPASPPPVPPTAPAPMSLPPAATEPGTGPPTESPPPRRRLAGIYRSSRIGMVTPLRDGMNLVAKEYVASRPDLQGVLVLSEFAGAHDELTAAVHVNPHDIEGLKDAIIAATEMPKAEQRRRMRSLRKRVREHDVEAWSRDFLAALAAAKKGADQ